MRKESESRQSFVLLAILSISTITILGSTAVSPALAGIKEAFPHLPDSSIQLVLTVPPLFIIPACFLCGPLCKRFGRKLVLLFGIVVYLLGGLGAGLMPSFFLVLVARAILGVGCGFITPLAQALIGAHFSGTLRERMMGYSASASYLMGILASVTVSRMAAIHWRLSFAIYLVAIFVLALNICYLPQDRKISHKIAQTVTEGTPPATISFKRKALLVMIAMGLINVAFYTFSVSISLFMAGEGIGGSSSSGIVVAVFMIAGFLVGLITAQIRNVAGVCTNAVAAGMMGLGYFILATGSSVLVLCVGAASIGGSYSIFYSSVFLRIAQLSSTAEENTRMVTYTTAAMFLGQSISTSLLHGVEQLIGLEGYRFRFIFLASMLVFAAILVSLNAVLHRNRKNQNENSSGGNKRGNV